MRRHRSRARLCAAFVVGLLSATVQSLAPPAAQADPRSSPELVPFVGSHRITATWGAPSGGYHSASNPAIDVAMPVGTPIHAAGSGTVLQVVVDRRHCDPRDYPDYVQGCINAGFGGSGVRVRIAHPDGRVSLYLHLDSIAGGIAEGSTVAAGQQIGTSGNTGISEGPHLHYAEEDAQRRPLDPGDWTACHGGSPVVHTDMQGRRGQVLRNDGYGCVQAPLADGSFVRVRESGAVFRLAGGAPVWVSSWDAFGGAQPHTDISQAQLDQMPTVPADGTFVVGAQRGEVYRIAGGAPVYVSTWDAFGGPQTTVTVDQYAIDNAGSGGLLDHLRFRPADGTFVVGAQRGEVYRIAGGAPVYVSTWDAFGGPQPTVTVDQQAIDRAESGGAFDHLRFRPADGTFIRGAQTGRVHRVTAGVPEYVPSWEPHGGPQPTVDVDQAAIDNAGKAGAWQHLATAVTPDPEPARFDDLGGHPHEQAVIAIAERGIASGLADGTFGPDRAITRGQMATFLTRALDLEPVVTEDFTDVAGTAHAPSIGAISRAGITSGYDDGSFRPGAPVSRGQMASFLARAMDLEPVPPPYPDAVGSAHAGNIGAVTRAGIARGSSDGTFRPGDPTTRGQMATFLARALGLVPRA